MPDGDGVVIDQDFFDEEADHLLPLGDFQRLRRFVQSLEERG